MNIRSLLTIIGIALIVKGVTMYFETLDIDDEGIACTMDAKLCYDGTAVGRSGPDCTFDSCPGNMELFMDPTIGISFGYPDRYVVEQDAPWWEEGYLHSIMLTDKDAGTPPSDSEGPPTINIDVYARDSSNRTIEDWIRGDSRSNFQLSSDGMLTQTSLGDIEGLSYSWDGLYRGDSIAIMENGRIFVFSVSYLAPEDRIKADFEGIVSTVLFDTEPPF
jgi:hypothetical protein